MLFGFNPVHVIRSIVTNTDDPAVGALARFSCPSLVPLDVIFRCTGNETPYFIFEVGMTKTIELNNVTEFIVSNYIINPTGTNPRTLIASFTFTLTTDKFIFINKIGEISNTISDNKFITRAPLQLNPATKDVLHLAMIASIIDTTTMITSVYKLIFSITNYEKPSPLFTAYLIPISFQPTLLHTNQLLAPHALSSISSQIMPMNDSSCVTQIVDPSFNFRINNCLNSEFPAVFIYAFLDQNITTIESVTLDIIDIYNYTLCKNALCSEYTGTPNESIITVYAPDFYSVIVNCNNMFSCDKRKDNLPCNLIDKVRSAINCIHVDNITNPNIGTVLIYGIFVYVFSALLYNKFDVIYTTRSYRCSFIENLQNSRFCKFVPLFTDPQFGLVGYENYYIL